MEINVKTVVIQLGDTEIKLSEEEARILHFKLKDLFERQTINIPSIWQDPGTYKYYPPIYDTRTTTGGTTTIICSEP